MELGALVVGEERSDGNGGAAWALGSRCVGRALGGTGAPLSLGDPWAGPPS